jgi:hypothetical protein
VISNQVKPLKLIGLIGLATGLFKLSIMPGHLWSRPEKIPIPISTALRQRLLIENSERQKSAHFWYSLELSVE